MKRKKLPVILASLLCLLATALLATACDTPRDPDDYGEIASVDIRFTTLNEEYVRNEKIDFSGLDVTVVYKNGNVHAFGYGIATVSGGDTSVAGKNKELTVSYGGYEKTYFYNVRNTRLTIHLGEHEWNEQTTVVKETEDNYTDLSAYEPHPDNDTDEFAGWFTDEGCTNPVDTNFDGMLDTSFDREIYAGYDADYSTQFSYEEEGNEITLTKFIGLDVFDDGALRIPETVKLRPVTKIAADFIDPDYASWYSYSSIDFGRKSKVREIGENAFAYLAVSSVNFPKTLVSIGNGAFAACKLTDLFFPVSLERIESSAFYMNTSLQTIDFARNGSLRFLGDSTFEYCASLLSVTLPDGVSSVGMFAFSHCENLTDVSFGKNIRQIGLHAFRDCPALEGIEISPLCEYYKSIDSNLYSKDGKTFIRYCFGKQDETFVMPEGVTSIYESAFDSNMVDSALKKIVLPAGLTYIGDYAFRSFDGDFTLPASLKTISPFAFSESLTETFRIDENNPCFTVNNGAIYSKDMTKLIAVPSRYSDEEFVLDSRTETIGTGALDYNETVRFVVIPSDSNLKKMEESSFVPFRMKNLCGVYLNGQQPFALDDNAMYSEGLSGANKNFYIFVPADNLQAYRDAWKNYRVFAENGEPTVTADELLGYLRTGDETDEAVIASMKQLLSSDFGSAEEFAGLLQDYIAGLSGENPQIYFSVAFNAIDGISYGNAIDDHTQSYIETFEKLVIPYLTEYYYALDDRTFGTILTFENVSDHYNRLPDGIREKISVDKEKIAAILQRLDEVTKIQKKILRDASDVMTGVTPSDIDKIRGILADYNRYDVGLVQKKWSDSLHIFGLLCSDRIADFLAMEITKDNFTEARTLCDRYNSLSSGEEQVGINLFLSQYLKTDTQRKHLYRYNDYRETYAEFAAKIPGFVEETNNDVLSNDLSAPFDAATCGAAIDRFDKLDFEERVSGAEPKRNAMALRLCIDTFNNVVISEDTYDVANAYYRNSLTFSEETWKNCGATEEELAKYDRQKEALLTLYGEHNAVLVAYLENPRELIGSEVTDFDLDALWRQAKEDPLYSLFYYNAKKDHEDKPDAATIAIPLEKGYYSIRRCLLEKKFVAEFSAVTAENYDAATDRIFGVFGKPGSLGISFFENLEDKTIASFYDSLLLSKEETEKYDELIAQYRNLSE